MIRFFSLAFFLMMCCGCVREHTQDWSVKKGSFIAFDEKQEVVVNCDGQTVAIHSEYFDYMFDWSEDYSRENTGTAWLINDREFVFGGWQNNSRRIMYLYDWQTKQINMLTDVVGFGFGDMFGWYLIMGTPKYADQSQFDVFVNGDLRASLCINARCNVVDTFIEDGTLWICPDEGDTMKLPLWCASFPTPCLSQTKDVVFWNNKE